MQYKCCVRIPFDTPQAAQIALSTLSVDKEPKPSVCQRTLEVQGHHLVAIFEATELRILRVASGWFLDMLQLTCETMEQFA
eukprot:gene8003-724_t